MSQSRTIDADLTTDIGEEELGTVEHNIMVVHVTAAREAVMADMAKPELLSYVRCRVVAHLLHAAHSVATYGSTEPVSVHCATRVLSA